MEYKNTNNYDKIDIKTDQFFSARLSSLLASNVQSFVTRGVAELWSADERGVFATVSLHMEALKAFLKAHPVQDRPLGIKHLSTQFAKQVIDAKRLQRGRVSRYDVTILQTVVELNEFMGRSTTSLRRLLQTTKQRATSIPKRRIKSGAEELRSGLIRYFRTTPAPEGKSHKLTFLRDKAVVMLLTSIPLRLNSLSLLRKEWLSDGYLILPIGAMKTRETVEIKLPEEVLRAINEYIALRSDACPYLIASKDGEELKKKSIYRFLYRRTQTALNFPLGPHAFRHLISTFAARATGSVDTAAALLIITRGVAQRHYDLNDASDRLNANLAKISALQGST